MALAMRRRGGVGAHRFIDHGMELDAGVGAANMRRQRQRERDEMVTGYEYGPALTVSDKNFDLASTVFECVTLYHCARPLLTAVPHVVWPLACLTKIKMGVWKAQTLSWQEVATVKRSIKHVGLFRPPVLTFTNSFVAAHGSAVSSTVVP